eukprot:2630773-Rhodomonas_salina.2
MVLGPVTDTAEPCPEIRSGPHMGSETERSFGAVSSSWCALPPRARMEVCMRWLGHAGPAALVGARAPQPALTNENEGKTMIMGASHALK